MQFALLGYFVPGVYTRTYAEVLPSLFAGTAVADLTLNSFPLFVGWVGIVFTVIGKSVRHPQRRRRRRRWAHGGLRPLSNARAHVLFFLCVWLFFFSL